jgi:hypothetical protein
VRGDSTGIGVPVRIVSPAAIRQTGKRSKFRERPEADLSVAAPPVARHLRGPESYEVPMPNSNSEPFSVTPGDGRAARAGRPPPRSSIPRGRKFPPLRPRPVMSPAQRRQIARGAEGGRGPARFLAEDERGGALADGALGEVGA